MNPFACGSFSGQLEDDIDLSPCSTPKRTRKNRDSKNPYANRGLDKFSALLAELEDKKQKIYTQKGSEDISFVRFVYSGSNNWKPIVVKAKDRRQDLHHHANAHENVKDKQMAQNSGTLDKHAIEATATVKEVQEPKGETSRSPQKKSTKWRWILSWENIRCPCFYFPVTIILILLFLAIYGRSFAILCTSVGWYLVPLIGKDGSSCPPSKRPKKKEYARRFSEKSIVHEGPSSPKSVLTGPADKSPPKHAHRKSWS